MLASLLVTALLGAAPCHLSLISPAAPPARLLQQAGTPTVLSEDDCSTAPARSPNSVYGQRAVSALGAVLGSAAGAIGGGLLGNAVAGDCGGECMFGPSELWLGMLIGLPLGAALGAHLTGDLMGGRGKWWGTALGTLGGVLLGALTLSLLSNADESADALGYLAWGTLFMPAAGAVTGYALSEPGVPGPCAAPDRFSAPRTPMLRMRFAF